MRRTTVVIVEDDEKFLESLAKIVASKGFNVEKFINPGDAYDFIKKKRKSIIMITDINFNGESGLDLLGKVGRTRPDIPVIVITGYATLESAVRALKLGAYDFIMKPFEPEIILHSLRRAYEKLRAERQRKENERKLKKLVKELEEKNREVEKLSSFKSFMISTASHDLKTLLTVLNGYHQMIGESCSHKLTEDEMSIFVEGRRCLKRALVMIESFLDYHAVEQGTINLNSTTFDIGELIDECIDFLAPYVEMKNIKIRRTNVSDKVLVYADRLKVGQILDNLMVNSIKFSPAGSEIVVSVSHAENGKALISVSDKGCGMPKEKIREILTSDPMIFKREGIGTVGLGLSICKKLVEVQNGELAIESEPGKGTTVSFTIPVP